MGFLPAYQPTITQAGSLRLDPDGQESGHFPCFILRCRFRVSRLRHAIGGRGGGEYGADTAGLCGLGHEAKVYRDSASRRTSALAIRRIHPDRTDIRPPTVQWTVGVFAIGWAGQDQAQSQTVCWH
jgi:hypothetical protein